MSFAVDVFLIHCSADVCERATLMSRLWRYSTNTLNHTSSILSTTVTEKRFGTEYPWSRQATGQVRVVINVLAAASTALLVKAGGEPRRGELHDGATRILGRVGWAILVPCYNPLHADEYLATEMGLTAAADLLNNRLTRETTSAPHLRLP